MKKLLFIFLILIVLGGGAFGGWYFFLKDNPDFSIAGLGKDEDGEDYAYRAAYDKQLSGTEYKVYAVLKKEFPKEYEIILDNLKSYETAYILGYYDGERYQQFGTSSIGTSSSIKAGYSEGYQTGAINAREFLSTMPEIDPVEMRAGAEVTNLRRAFANATFAAPDKDLRNVIGMSLALHKRVLAEEGPETCNKFAAMGPAVLGEKFDNYLVDLDLQTAAMLKALADGRKSGETRGAPTKDDFEILVRTMAANDIPEETIQVIMQQDFQNEQFCPALISLIETLDGMESDAGTRLRANFVRTLAAG